MFELSKYFSYHFILLILSVGLLSCGGGGGGNNGVGAQRVEGSLRLESPAAIVTSVDLNNDGLKDLIIATGANDGERHPVRFIISNGDGTFRDATLELAGYIPMFDKPRPVVGDFNNDNKNDVAIFGLGTKPAGSGSFLSQPPVLFLSNNLGAFDSSTALADAVANHNRDFAFDASQCVGCPFSGNAMSIKMGAAIDINVDENLDIYVESTGGLNITNHFYMNNGDGTFTIDFKNRQTERAHINFGNFEPGFQFWRHLTSAFVDVNNDNFPDLIMGQLTADETFQTEANSHVFINDGNGFYTAANRINLPQTTFSGGFTGVSAIASGDINNDGFMDLILAHERKFNIANSDDFENQTGRFIQLLINDGTGDFIDESAVRMGSQASTTLSTDPFHKNIKLKNTPSYMKLIDLNNDGKNDLLLNLPNTFLSNAAPLIYLKSGAGNFEAQATDSITQADIFYGFSVMPIDVDGNATIDFASIGFKDGKVSIQVSITP